MKMTKEDMDSSIRRNRDTGDIPRRKVKEKDKGEVTQLGQCDSG